MGKKTETPADGGEVKTAEPVTVFATCLLSEDGKRYQKGEALTLTPERAAALGDCVSASAPE